ncbi:helix-turn-helix domain-containing protein [Bacteroides salyersiae]|nr:helix-turn-helix domain-containing protein [Bacteroides salyersiae]MCS3283536.1 helix-turn-helix domain-containing protein [Bacteroides salyersiae]
MLSVRFFRVVVGVVVDIFGHARSFSDRKKQPVIQSYIFAPVKKNGILTKINISVMEIVTIEKRTFELWKQRFENFVGRVDALCVPLRRKRDKWLDNCETCRLLNVSARTMQTYRDTGKLPYSQINNKIYYKASDVETFLLDQVRDNSKK